MSTSSAPAATGWIDLFDGQSLDGWRARGKPHQPAAHTWLIVGEIDVHPENPRLLIGRPGTGILLNGDDGRTIDLHTELEHGSCELHVEFAVAEKSNSGVYLQGQYEIQILDSWGESQNQLSVKSCGAIYPRWNEETKSNYEGEAPSVNAARAPGEWQSFDIVFHAPKFDGTGRKVANARFERIDQNGVTIHRDYECSGPTRGAWNPEDIARGPLRLQGDHGPVAFRNLRIKLLEE